MKDRNKTQKFASTALNKFRDHKPPTIKENAGYADTNKKNRIWNTEKILPDTERVSFLLDDKYFNKPKNSMLKAAIKEDHQKDLSERGEDCKDQWMDNVEMVDLDLNSVSDLSYAPKRYMDSSYGIGSFYKDGILLRFNNKKNNSTFHIILNPLTSSTDFQSETVELKLHKDVNFEQDMGCFMIQEHGSMHNRFEQDTVYMLCDWQDWKKEHFNNFNFPIYIMFENFSKTRAVKINLKDNLHINHIKNTFLKDNTCLEKNPFKYGFPKGMPFSMYKRILDAKGSCTSAIYALRQESPNIAGIKKGLLKGSWGVSVEHNIRRAVVMLRDYNKLPREALLRIKKTVTSEKGVAEDGHSYVRSSLTKNKELKNFLVDIYDLAISCLENNSTSSVVEGVINFIEKHKKIDVTNKLFIDQIYEKKDLLAIVQFYAVRNEKTGETDFPSGKPTGAIKKVLEQVSHISQAANYLFLLIALLNRTGEGLNLPSGAIVDTENFTNADCVIYWTHTPQILLLEYFTGISVNNKAPLLIENGKVENDTSVDGSSLNDFHRIERCEPSVPDSRAIPTELDLEIKPIIDEAFDNEIYNIIWGSGAELDDDIFRYLKFFELDNHIVIFACDKRNRYLVETMNKDARKFSGLFFNKTNHPSTEIEETTRSIYIKFATLIRDIKVIVDRVSNLPFQGRRQPRNLEVPLDEPMEIMTPRSRYQRRRLNGSGRNVNIYKTAGFRIAHLRRLVGDAKASKEAINKARRDPRIKNIPPGYTYVSGANWDKRQMSEREILYRNKTLTEVFYATDKEYEKVQTIDKMSGLAFEEYSKSYLQRRKLKVDFSRNVDHGIDIIAYEKDTKVVVQCKNNRKKPVGPDIIRALVGSRDYKNSEGPVRGMIIASGGFTRGARDEAEINRVELISDDILNYEVE